MSGGVPPVWSETRFLELVNQLRPALHRYCARLMGSVLDGEDVVQDTLFRAFVSLKDLDEQPPLRPWLFRIAHNRALDLIKSRDVRRAEPIDAGVHLVDLASLSPIESAIRREGVETALGCFAELPLLQRSVVILKDVLGETLVEIAVQLDLTVDAVKGYLARGRAQLRRVDVPARRYAGSGAASVTAVRYVTLFNERNWDGLRELLADDVKLSQATQPARRGAADVGLFFTMYARLDGVWLAPAWLEGREVIAVFENRHDAQPAYIMRLEWAGDFIGFIHDYRYARYLLDDAVLVLADH